MIFMPVTYINIPREVEVYFTNHDEMNDQGLPFIDHIPECLVKHFSYEACINEWVYRKRPNVDSFSQNVVYYDCIVYEPATGWHELMLLNDLNAYFTRKV